MDAESPERTPEVEKELSRYFELIEKYEGFFMNFFLSVPLLSCIDPVDLEGKCGGDVIDCANFAIAKYNKNQKHHRKERHLKLVKVLFATSSLCAGHIYYITFVAENARGKHRRTYEAKVYRGIPRSVKKVMLFRLQPSNHVVPPTDYPVFEDIDYSEGED